MKCPNCGFDSPAEMRLCGLCGTRLAQVCSECSFANPLNYRFCGMCGTLLSEARVPAQLAEAEPAMEAAARPRPTPVQL